MFVGIVGSMSFLVIIERLPNASNKLIASTLFLLILLSAFTLYKPTERRLIVQLLGFSLILPIMIIEGILFFISDSAAWYQAPLGNIKGFSQLKQTIQEGGIFKSDLNEMVIGESTPVNFITNSKGFRNDKEFDYTPPEETFRILYIGDSFVGGYDVGQEEMSGKIIEDKLNQIIKQKMRLPWQQVEVLVALVEEPGLGWWWLQEHGFKYNPHLIIFGVCLGNDLAQSYLSMDEKGHFEIISNEQNNNIISKRSASAIGFTTPPFSDLYLPDNAHILRRPPSRLNRFFQRLGHAYIFQRIEFYLFGESEGITSWYGDSWYGDNFTNNPIHAFDPIHGLGLFYVPTLPEVDVAFVRFQMLMKGMYDSAQQRDIDFIPVLFPQRFQVTQGDWEATVNQFSLNSEHFDLQLPNRRIIESFKNLGIPHLDLLPNMRKEAGAIRQRVYMPLADMHWNAIGHRIAGEEIAKYIGADYLEN